MKDNPETQTLHFHHHFQLHEDHQLQQQQQQHYLNFDEDEVDSSSRSSGEAASKKPKQVNGEPSNLPRGRPPGSKNKPRPPVVITRVAESSSALRPQLLEIADGSDVASSIASFSRRRGLGVCVLSGRGAVSTVTLNGGGAAEEEAVEFRGRFEILSISATFLPPAMEEVVAPPAVSVSLAGPQGRIFGGMVAGPLVAAGPVVLVVAVFLNPSFHRLPAEEDGASVSVSVSGSGDVEESEQQ